MEVAVADLEATVRAFTPRFRARQQTRSLNEQIIASRTLGSFTSSEKVRSFEMLPTVSPSESYSENAGRLRPSSPAPSPIARSFTDSAHAPKMF